MPDVRPTATPDTPRRNALRLPPWAWRSAFFSTMLAVLLLSLAPLDAPLPSTGWDKTNHLFGFSVLGVLGMMAYPGATARVVVGLVLHGALVEVLQSFTPHRSAEWGDLLADAVGVLLGVALARALQRVARGRAAPRQHADLSGR